MKDEFNDFDDLEEDFEDLDSFFEQDKYQYEEEIQLEQNDISTEYEYLNYDYETIDRNNEIDEYEEYEDEYDTKSNFRTNIVKYILIIICIFLVIWLLSLAVKSINKKNIKSEKVEEVKVITKKDYDYNTMFEKVKLASLKYYNEKRTQEEIGSEKTLKLLNSLQYLKDVPEGYNIEQSNVKLSKGVDSYNLTVTLITDEDKKIKNYLVSNYSYCIDTFLCEKQAILSETEPVEEPKEEQKPKLSTWGLWSSYEKTSCDTKAVTCNQNDSNCLTEIKLYERKEKLDNYKKVYTSSRNAFSNNPNENINICSNYDYIKINNIYYRTEKNSNFKMVGAIKKDTKSNYYNWRYDGRQSYVTPPSDTTTTRYVFVEADYSNCGNTCSNNPKYYYDKYTFTKPLVATNNPSKDCNSLISKSIPSYTIAKQNINVSRNEELYGTVCYKSTRTRKIIEE